MRTSLSTCLLVLSLACLCSLSGCRTRARQDNAEVKDHDAAGRVIAEAVEPPAPAASPPWTSPSPTLTPLTDLLPKGELYTSFDGRFIIRLPPDFPRFDRQRGFTEIYGRRHEHEVFKSKTVRGWLQLLYYDTPEGVPEVLGAHEYLKRALSFSSRQWGWAGAYDVKETTVRGHPALSVYYSQGKAHVRMNMILVGRRLYVVGYTGPDRADLDSADINASFDSFVAF